MSAYRVRPAHISVLVNALAYYQVLDPAKSTAADYRAVGQDLWRENVRSVNFRYVERKRAGHYLLETTEAPLHPVAVLAAVHGYVYQSCEHPTWEKSRAHQLIEALKEAIAQRHPELFEMMPRPAYGPGKMMPRYTLWEVFTEGPWHADTLDQATIEYYRTIVPSDPFVVASQQSQEA